MKKETNPLSTQKSLRSKAKEQSYVPQKSLFMNSYLLQSGALLRTPASPAVLSDDFSLIHEVDNFIAQFQQPSADPTPA